MKVIILLLALFPLGALKAYVFSMYWVWFFTPAFGINAPSLLVIYGLITMATIPNAYNRTTVSDDAFDVIGFSLVFSLITLLIGYVVHIFA